MHNSEKFVGDDEIRKHGFKIHDRPNNKEPVWIRKGQLFPQTVVREIIRKELIEKDKK